MEWCNCPHAINHTSTYSWLRKHCKGANLPFATPSWSWSWSSAATALLWYIKPPLCICQTLTRKKHYLVVPQCCICSPLLFCFVNFSLVDGSAGICWYICMWWCNLWSHPAPRDAQKLSLWLALTIHKSSVGIFFLFFLCRNVFLFFFLP